jgi:hypothetical protein
MRSATSIAQGGWMGKLSKSAAPGFSAIFSEAWVYFASRGKFVAMARLNGIAM